MKIVIVGAGIAGLTTAICLARKGTKILVLEQRQTNSDSSELGAGLQVSANGCKILEDIGVMELIEKSACLPKYMEMKMGGSGRNILKLELKNTSVKRWGAPYIHIQRDDLVKALTQKLNELMPEAIRANSRVVKYEKMGNGSVACLENGGRIEADVLIAADGIRSAVRQQMYPKQKNEFTGYVAWRTQVSVKALGEFAPPKSACVWVGDDKHAVTTRVNGGDVVNFVGVVQQKQWDTEEWKKKGERKEAIKDFQNWNQTVQKILENSDDIHKWAIFDHEPLESWSDGNVVLIGDAAHPMLPSMAQGAVMAIEDGAMLAKMLCENGEVNVSETLEAFEKKRKKRVESVRKMAERNMRMFHRGNALGVATTFAPIWIAAQVMPNVIHWRHDKIYGYNAI